jgi:hypothetical protein
MKQNVEQGYAQQRERFENNETFVQVCKFDMKQSIDDKSILKIRNENREGKPVLIERKEKRREKWKKTCRGKFFLQEIVQKKEG